MSVSLLPGIISAAIVRVKAVIAVCTPPTVVFKSVAMLLMATFIVVAAKLQRNCARTSGTSIALVATCASAATVSAVVADDFAICRKRSREDHSAPAQPEPQRCRHGGCAR